jgi:hypothetical protein
MTESQSSNFPPDATPITTEQLFMIIGELSVQVRILQGMLRQKLEPEINGAVKGERSLQSQDN